jgi:hypothetical protein
MTNDPWSDLRSIWQQDPLSADAAIVIAQVRRAERARSTARTTRILVVIAAVGALAGAVLHAVTPLEAVLAIAVGASIAAYWIATTVIERRQYGLLGAAGDSYVAARRSWLRTELRLLQFVWGVVGLELVFLLPWWAAGIPIHFGSFGTAAALAAWWLPIGGLTAFLAWSVRRYRSFSREWRALGQRRENDMDVKDSSLT